MGTFRKHKLTNIGRLREDNTELSREQVAEALGVTVPYIQMLETIPARKPSIGLAKEMCVLYKCTLEDVFRENKQVKKLKKLKKVACI